MPKKRVSITIEEELLQELERKVNRGLGYSLSAVIEEAVRTWLAASRDGQKSGDKEATACCAR